MAAGYIGVLIKRAKISLIKGNGFPFPFLFQSISDRIKIPIVLQKSSRILPISKRKQPVKPVYAAAMENNLTKRKSIIDVQLPARFDHFNRFIRRQQYYTYTMSIICHPQQIFLVILFAI